MNAPLQTYSLCYLTFVKFYLHYFLLGENELIWDEMLDKRGEHAALVGPSVHNQPIESHWNFVNDRVTEPFKRQFTVMEKDGWLDVTNELDMLILHYVFFPLIQVSILWGVEAYFHHRLEHFMSSLARFNIFLIFQSIHSHDFTSLDFFQANLSQFVKAMNKHKISTEGNHTPLQLLKMYGHLKQQYENRPIDQSEEDAEFSYRDPRTLERPLNQQWCDELDEFPEELRDQLAHLKKPKTIMGGVKTYKKALRIVHDFYSEMFSV